MRRQGFTLVELIVAVSITLLIASGVLVSINNFSSSEKNNATANDVLEELRLARNFAITSQLPPSFPANRSLQYTQMVLAGGSMAVQAVDNNNVAYAYPSTIKTLDVGVGATFTNTAPGGLASDFPSKAYFSVFKGSLMKYSVAAGKAILTDTADKLRIQIYYQGGTANYVWITSPGQICAGQFCTN